MLEEFLGQWKLTNSDGTVAWEEFLAYYSDVSLSIDNDVLFVELVRRTWRL